ncbi:hypothetical protein, partial [Marinobacter sp. NFXS9]|uniref:hypothetical protein n=1 Tax=Marinobacter sp. NFXS9 TaxID=2818433 RepID=UPI0032DEA07D
STKANWLSPVKRAMDPPTAGEQENNGKGCGERLGNGFFYSLVRQKMMDYGEIIKTSRDYRGFLSKVLLGAPDDLKEDYLSPKDQLTLETAYLVLRKGLIVVKSRIRSEEKMRILDEMLVISYEAFLAGEEKKARYTLQEIMGIIWPSVRMRSKYEQEAKVRLGFNA